MHNAKRRGYLESPSGAPLDESQRLRLMGTFKGEAERCEDELLQHGVPSIEEGTGIWYCRRMVKETAKAEKCSKAGKKGGGSPILTTNTTNTEVPEARSHISLKGTFKGEEQHPPQLEKFPVLLEKINCQNPSIEDAVAAIRASNESFAKVSHFAIEETLKSQPDRSKWYEAIKSMAIHNSEQKMIKPPLRLQNYLLGKPGTESHIEQKKSKAKATDEQIFRDWDSLGKHIFSLTHGISHADFADKLRVDLADMKQADFGRKYKATAENVRELLNNYGY